MRPHTTRKGLTLPQQFLFLRNSKTAAGSGILTPQRLEWHFAARPTPMSREYQIRIELQNDATPDVTVLEPDVRALAGTRDLPHIYHNPDRLCLYLPGTGQWDASKRLDETIVPWTHLWLTYFEGWLVSGEWKGGGKHPNEENEAPGNRALRRSLARFQ